MTVDECLRARADGGPASAPAVLSRLYRAVSLGALALVALGAFEAVAAGRWTTNRPASRSAVSRTRLPGVSPHQCRTVAGNRT